MKKLISLLMIVFIFTGCTEATWELMYRDARVIYQDTKYVIHEFKDVQEGK